MKKIMVFDDEEDVRYLIVYQIEKMKYFSVIGEAGDGNEGLALCLKLQPDIILTDIRMPGLNGLELLKGIKKDLPFSEVILISGYEEFDYAKQALELGAVSYLLKPLDENELYTALKHASEIIDQRNQKMKQMEDMKSTIEKLQSGLLFLDQDSPKGTYSREVEKIMDYIKENYMRDIALNDLAKIVFMNSSYLSDKFKKETGISLNNYINDIRQEAAMKLLRQPLKIREVAQMVGYKDVSYFIRLFKKNTGMTPIEYRMQQCNLPFGLIGSEGND